MAQIVLDVLYEDNHLLVLNKPAGIATQGSEAGVPTLLALAKSYVKQKYHKPGNVYLGTISRLDAAVSGVVVFARTSKAAARLSEQFRSRAVRKVYWAVVSSKPADDQTCVDWLVKDEARHVMRVADRETAGACIARLHYRLKQRLARGWLLEIELETGRKHQIRVQLSARGYPVVGDRKYGSRQPFADGIALHGRSLELAHPTRPEKLTLVARPPATWLRLGIE